MKKFFVGLTFFTFPFSSVFAAPGYFLKHGATEVKNSVNRSKSETINFSARIQQNLIGEVVSVDSAGGKIVVLTEAKTSVSASFNDKTAFKRVLPGQTSLANAEQIKITDIKPGDRVLIPGGITEGQTPVRQIIVMARQAINSKREEEAEKRRARTINGRIVAVNAEKKEITIQSRGRGAAETLTIAASGNVKMLRYAPDSLKTNDAVAGSFTDLRVGDQIRVIGDRSSDGTRVTAEEIISGSVTRAVGSITEINSARGEVVVKNIQTGQLMTIAIGKNTTLRRITPEVAETLKQRFERRRERQNEHSSSDNSSQQTQANRRRNREERRNQNGDGQQTNRNPRQLFDSLPAITISGLKKGDAVLITGTGTGGNNSQLTAVSIVSGEGELQQILQQTQGGRNGASNMSPGLPGNVGGGNAGSDDDEPRK